MVFSISDVLVQHKLPFYNLSNTVQPTIQNEAKATIFSNRGTAKNQLWGSIWRRKDANSPTSKADGRTRHRTSKSEVKRSPRQVSYKNNLVVGDKVLIDNKLSCSHQRTRNFHRCGLDLLKLQKSSTSRMWKLK